MRQRRLVAALLLSSKLALAQFTQRDRSWSAPAQSGSPNKASRSRSLPTAIPQSRAGRLTIRAPGQPARLRRRGSTVSWVYTGSGGGGPSKLDDRFRESCHNSGFSGTYIGGVYPRWSGMEIWAAWRRAIELSLGDADTAKLRSIAQSRTEPASRVERARIRYWLRGDRVARRGNRFPAVPLPQQLRQAPSR
jgi:hypothetical protein